LLDISFESHKLGRLLVF